MATGKVSIILEAKDRASREIKNAEGAMGKLRASWKAAAVVAAAVTAAVAGLVVGLDKLATRGGEVIGVQNAFNRVFGNSPAALEKMRASTRGLISDMDLMTQANRAAALGAVRTADDFSELAEVSLALGRAQGVDAKMALESLALGIGRQSRLLLDNLGIIVNVEQANQQYAASLGKAASELSDAERAEAFRTAAMEAARQKMQELGGVTETNADNIQRMKTATINAKDAMAEWVAESPALERALDRIAAAARGVGAAFGWIRGLFTDDMDLQGLLMAGQHELRDPAPITVGAPDLRIPGIPDAALEGFDSLGIAAPGAVRGARRGAGAHGLTPKAPRALTPGEVAMAGATVAPGLEGVAALHEVDGAVSEFNAAAMAAVGSLHALGLAAINGSLGIDDLVASIGNVIGASVGGPLGALIGAVGSLAGAAFADDKPMPVRMTDVSDRAANKLKDRGEGPDVQVFLNGNLATKEELREAGYRLKRLSRLRGESVGGM